MKQHITVEQLNEVDFDIFEKIRALTDVTTGIKSDMSEKMNIGKMIEILDAENYVVNVNSSEHTVSVGSIKQGKTFNNEQLCDSLWQAVKHILGGE